MNIFKIYVQLQLYHINLFITLLDNFMDLNKSNFHILYNEILKKIENTLDGFISQKEIDYEINHHIMTISFSKKNKIIVSKQEFLKQIWMATKKNGYHFIYQKNNWICNRSKKNFWDILQETFYLQIGDIINFKKFII